MPHLARTLVAAALLSIGCSTNVIGGGGGGSGGERTEFGGTGGASGDVGTTGSGTGTGFTDAGASVPPPSQSSQCTGPVGGQCEATYPAPGPSGEKCFDCSCRCCEAAPEMPACLADPACAAWLACLRTCEYGMPCDQICGVACQTGTEIACALVDCHNWVCGAACGESL